MRKMFMLIALLGLAMTSCDKNFEPIGDTQKGGSGISTGENNENNSDAEDETYWGDNAAYHLWFNLLDESGKNVLAQDEGAIYEIEITYDGVQYKYEGETRTRAASFYPMAIRTSALSKGTFGFGDFAVNSESMFTITFRDNKWIVEQQSELNPQDINGELIFSVKINDVMQDNKHAGPFELIIE